MIPTAKSNVGTSRRRLLLSHRRLGRKAPVPASSPRHPVSRPTAREISGLSIDPTQESRSLTQKGNSRASSARKATAPDSSSAPTALSSIRAAKSGSPTPATHGLPSSTPKRNETRTSAQRQQNERP